MDSFNPTTKTQAALTAALQAASAAGNPEIRPAHLLLALLTQNDGIAAPLLEAVGVEPATIRTEAQRLIDRLPQISGASAQPQLSRESLAAITTAQQLATDSGFIRRQRKLSGPSFAQGLVFTWLDNPYAALDDLAARDGQGAVAQDLMVTEPFTDRLDGNHRPSCIKRCGHSCEE